MRISDWSSDVCSSDLMTTQTEPGHLCPLTMTHAAVPALRRQPEIAGMLLPKMLSRHYDQRFRPPGEEAAITLGMVMTEKQGGTDVRANTTAARPASAAGTGQDYLLGGPKGFPSDRKDFR